MEEKSQEELVMEARFRKLAAELLEANASPFFKKYWSGEIQIIYCWEPVNAYTFFLITKSGSAGGLSFLSLNMRLAVNDLFQSIYENSYTL